jgi:HAD superfamily hydrolase (TIGR01490 family)
VGIAFFDFDRTLIAANSGVLWVRRELALGHITRLQAARAGLWLLRYELGVATMEDAVRRAISALAGHPERDLRERTETFYRQAVRGLYRPGGLRALASHRALGEKVVLLTASSNYLAELVSQELRLDGFLCNRFEVDARGLHTGLPLGTLCFGAGKRALAEAFAREASVSLEACAFYTDSFSDLPVLQVVGRPVAVHPDRRLRRHARKQGWEIADWGVPEGDLDSPLGPSLAS